MREDVEVTITPTEYHVKCDKCPFEIRTVDIRFANRIKGDHIIAHARDLVYGGRL